MRRSVTGELALAAAAQQLAETTTAAPSTEPKTRKWTNDEVIAKLETAPSQQRVPGRTLLKGHTWDGRDIPGRGGAAAPRLRQMQAGQHREAKS